MTDRVKLTKRARAIEVLSALECGAVLRFRYQARPWVLISRGGVNTAVGNEVAMWLRAQLYITQTPNRGNDNFEEWSITESGRALLSDAGDD